MFPLSRPPEPRTPPRGLVYALFALLYCLLVDEPEAPPSLGLALRRLLLPLRLVVVVVSPFFSSLFSSFIFFLAPPFLRLRLRGGPLLDPPRIGARLGAAVGAGSPKILAKIDTRRNTSNSRSDPLGGLLPTLKFTRQTHLQFLKAWETGPRTAGRGKRSLWTSPLVNFLRNLPVLFECAVSVYGVA